MMVGNMGFLDQGLSWFLNRYRVRLLIRAAGRCREIVEYAFARPRINHFFHIVSSEREASTAIINCLQSVYDQDYPRDLIRHLVIDDASPDDTDGLISTWLNKHPDNTVDYQRNTTRAGAFANNLAGFRRARPREIVLELNGDDWLPDDGVLRFLDKVYADPEVWTTFNTFARADGVVPIALGPSRRVLRDGRIREIPWTTSALHSFRMELFSHIDPVAFLNPSTGMLWESAHDMATYLPMIELAGVHSRHIFRTTYFYNIRDTSDEVLDRTGQLAAAAGIRNLPPHSPLDSLYRETRSESSGR